MLSAETSPAEPSTVAGALGKTAQAENFPVASRFLPKRLRRPVVAFYRFARAADDVADSSTLSPEDKLAILAAADAALIGQPAAFGDHPAVARAAAAAPVMVATGVAIEHCRHLLQAFMKDARQSRYQTWSDLLLYCRYSASPVGRFLLDLHGEDRTLWPMSDALCDAHQVLNHVQDCRQDYERLDRVYLPLRWMEAEGVAVEDLARDRCSPGMRRVLDRTLEHTAELLARARPFPAAIRSRGLSMQAGATLAMGERLLGLLRRNDPLARHIEMGAAAKLACVVRGAAGALVRR